MSKWQPVRLASAKVVLSRDPDHFIWENFDDDAGKVILVCPIDEKPPCTATRGFLVHPDYRRRGCSKICEHQILAD